MFCEQCGAELDRDARFCSTCGKQIAHEGGESFGRRVVEGMATVRLGPSRLNWLVVGALVVLVLGGALLWLSSLDNVDVLDAVNVKGELSRRRAEDLIRNSPEFQALRSVVHFHSQGFGKGVDQKMWIEPGIHAGKLYHNYFVTQKARTIVSSVSHSSLTLVAPAETPSLEITGVTDAMSFGGSVPGIKEVEFMWNYKNVPSGVKRFASSGGNGKGYIRLYDDGWRLEKVSVMASREPMRLSAEDQAAETTDIGAWERRIAESKTPQRTFGSFTYYMGSIEEVKSGTYPNQIELTDIGFSYNERDYSYMGVRGRPCMMWFGNVGEISEGQTVGGPPEYDIGVEAKLRRTEGCGGALVTFATAAERDRFKGALISALEAWKARFPDIASAELTRKEIFGE